MKEYSDDLERVSSWLHTPVLRAVAEWHKTFGTPFKTETVISWLVTERGYDLYTAEHMTADDLIRVLREGSLGRRLGSPPTPLQVNIWAALDGHAMTKDELAHKVAGGDTSRLYYTNRSKKTGGLKELTAVGLVKNKRTVGYYRPDAPPPG